MRTANASYGIQATLVKMTKELVQQISRDYSSQEGTAQGAAHPATAQQGSPDRHTTICSRHITEIMPSARAGLPCADIECVGALGHGGQCAERSGEGTQQGYAASVPILIRDIHSRASVCEALHRPQRDPERLLELDCSASEVSAFALPGRSSRASDAGGPVAWGLQAMDATEIQGKEGQRLNAALGAQLEEAPASHQYFEPGTVLPMPSHDDAKESTTEKGSSSPKWSTDEVEAPKEAGESAPQVIWNENGAFADATAASVHESIRPAVPMMGITARILAAGGAQ
jgi:hypothetical protein